MDDPFAILGLPRSADLGRADVDRAYFAALEAAHPDKVAGGDEAARRRAELAAARINEAYRALRTPVGRLETLCRLGGIDLDSSDPKRGAPMPDTAFLTEMIERREAIEAARRAGAGALEDLRDAVEDEADEAVAQARRALAGGDVAAAARALVRRRYLARLLDEIEEAMS